MSKLESLVSAIAFQNNLHDPESEAFKLKNPLLVRSFGRPGKHEIDEQGRRVFDSLVSGYRACLFDIALKVGGNSRAGLGKTDTIERLLASYGIRGAAQTDRVVKFLRKAFADPTIAGSTALSYFVEEPGE